MTNNSIRETLFANLENVNLLKNIKLIEITFLIFFIMKTGDFDYSLMKIFQKFNNPGYFLIF